MGNAQRMSYADAAWLQMDQPSNLMVITGVLWFEGRPDWDGVAETIRARLVERFPRFRQRVVEGGGPLSGPYWEDDPDFDLERHLHRIALARPGDREVLEAFVAHQMAIPLDRSMPLWEFHLVDGYEDGAALVGRVHHCIADGIALARVLFSLTDESPDAGIAPHDPQAERADGRPGRLGRLTGLATDATSLARSLAGRVARETIETGRNPGRLRELAGELAGEGRESAETLAKLLFSGADPRTPLKGELGVPQRVAWSSPIPLEDVKAMGHVTGTTANDVLLAAIAGALRRYLEARGGSVDELTTFVPFNLRPLDQPLPPKLGNRFGLVFLRLPVGIEDPRSRLDEVHHRMQRIKRSPEGLISYAVLEAIGRAPARVEKALLGLFTARGSAVTTNVPGPEQPVYMAGTKVRGLLVWAPRSGDVSMSLTSISYDGEVTLGLMSDAGLVPDPEAIVAAFERELEWLRSADALAAGV
jgi:diacylglycerol O-acyltransferase / wax synthase